MHKGRQQGRRGFSMVEVVLAVLVLGIGVLTVVGLMSGGLQMSKGGTDDLQVAMFANDVMEGMQERASVATNATPFSGAIQIVLAAAPLKPTAAPMWAGGETIEASSGQRVFHYTPQADPNNTVDFVCRYQLQVGDAPASVASVAAVQSRVAAIRLDVQNGRFGQTATQTFYREVFQFVK
jgi:Tfp pilus assembly protein PilV